MINSKKAEKSENCTDNDYLRENVLFLTYILVYVMH